MRLLYVALTRAEERLYMTAAVKGLQKKLETARSELTDPLEPAKLLKARSMVDWLIPAVLSDGGRTLRMTIHAPEECEAAVDAAAEQGPVEAETLRLLERQLSFRYPHAGAEALPSKLTATELKERGDDAQDDDAAALLPAARRSPSACRTLPGRKSPSPERRRAPPPTWCCSTWTLAKPEVSRTCAGRSSGCACSAFSPTGRPRRSDRPHAHEEALRRSAERYTPAAAQPTPPRSSASAASRSGSACSTSSPSGGRCPAEKELIPAKKALQSALSCDTILFAPCNYDSRSQSWQP